MCVGVNIPTRYPVKSPYRNTPSISTTRGFIPDLEFLPWNMILAKVMTLSQDLLSTVGPPTLDPILGETDSITFRIGMSMT
ncbi:hypothetical protein CDV36_005362 [Fusarium kuroshium]|uniref:Uncharacterized protein n=1 Tax=Fusarium kuroshium TaxID=2010991 RepID=A0A3M2SBP3_9HYPO|nr:hypothetical protein CDV36_005362 [Fusarium kuroshium]